jgi:hypothetical protein
MGREETLTAKPLWECLSCDRLEFSEPVIADDWDGETTGPDCVSCDKTMDLVEEPNPNYLFEAIAQHFHRDTGFVRPGKDCRLHDAETREAEFRRWSES